ncbi:carbohydrate ABC transporter permease [Kibdelosporangium phytohabitans]|uniref:Sugar ABC transporter permease n=1 Tax=Kibdelosporangium phytohabitans TaxID=860235 RepID=A0A0N9IAR8_9PSEU|nr:carbohydrate ABC transporter permease [Kibdelosporangium phytohabitans]ALG12202.1 sugar ABC transporter permease [Kibdelosporangium phytohabitans]MBE1463734.1 multiple sugar transport system permease protein [Kibdelosporangium phytohabitans]
MTTTTRRRRPSRRAALYATLIIGAAMSVFPYWLIVSTALKPRGELFEAAPWAPPSSPTLENLGALLSSDFAQSILNTLIFVTVLTVGQLIFTTLAAYAFARLDFRGRNALFWLYLATLMVPNVVTLIPLFLIMRELDLVNSWYGLVAPYVFGTPYGIFLMRQFFRSIPREIEEAARVDGAGHLTILWRIILPLSRPILATLAIVTVISSWNNFLWPLIITSSADTRVITVAIAALRSEIGIDYTRMMAGSLLTLLPMLLVFVFFQRYIVRSVALTGLK